MDNSTSTSTINQTPATAPAATTSSRVGDILRAIGVLAAEFGPLFIHSVHGQGVLAAGEQSIAVLLGGATV